MLDSNRDYDPQHDKMGKKFAEANRRRYTFWGKVETWCEEHPKGWLRIQVTTVGAVLVLAVHHASTFW